MVSVTPAVPPLETGTIGVEGPGNEISKKISKVELKTPLSEGAGMTHLRAANRKARR
jgi:hypothetical protein